MKTVLIFDTEDPKGMENTIHIVEHLAAQYMNRHPSIYDETFGKIEFIKTIRAFMKEAEEAEELGNPSDGSSLRFAKRFADKVWKAKKDKKKLF